ncbi:hypothetical protein GCM10018772_31440 [Streptomyces fumanus]|uniref:Uncharacterized protein n=1 Tax=Streptomyces fumanus TaxID=67302 RepID=A0A919E286_9ACTN|nr:hypothetical protein GCM10018772_31440 [Streptomyces fumanus]
MEAPSAASWAPAGPSEPSSSLSPSARSPGRTQAATAACNRVSPDVPDELDESDASEPSGFSVSPDTDNTRVAVSTVAPAGRPADSRATVSRGSRGSPAPRSDSVRASGTGPALPDVGSADDSRCFDLSGDSPATDASSITEP